MRIGGRRPTINTSPAWSPPASPGSSCGAIRTIGPPTILPRSKPITGPKAPLGAGGYDFLADPNQRADESPVFWHPDELATVVVLTAAPTGNGAPCLSLGDLPGDILRRDGEDGAHLLVKDGTARHQLWLIDPPDGAIRLAAIIPLDANLPQRADATIRFWRSMAHGRPRPAQSPMRRADRLITALRALDARQAGASYRTIAETLFDPCRITAEPWKTSSLRDTVIRLARTGSAMMCGDYRNLLRSHRPD